MSGYIVMEEDDSINPFTNTADIDKVELVEPKQSKKRNQRILAALFFAVVVGAIVVILYFTLYKTKVKQETLPFFVEMVKDMNKKADPCGDFYQYACGGYIKRHKGDLIANKLSALQANNDPVTKEAIEAIHKEGSNNGALNKAANYYSLCLKNANFSRYIGLSPYWQALKDIGGAPIVDRFWSNASWTVVKALQKMYLNYGTHPLFKVGVRANLKNTSQHIFVVSFPDIGLETKIAEKNMFDVMFGNEKMDFEDELEMLSKLTKSFKDTTKEAFIEAIAAKSSRSRSDIENDLSSATNLESNIVQDFLAAAKGYSTHSVYETITVKELTTLMNNTFQWEEFLGGLVKGISNRTVSNETIIGLLVPKGFLLNISSTLRNQTSKNLANFFGWVLLKKLSPALRDVYFNAYHNTRHTKKVHERWRDCLKDTEINMPLTTGLMFVEKTVTDTKRNQTVRLLKDIRQAFRQGVRNVSWLDQTTRAAVQLKVQNMIDVIADPVDIVERKALERRYADVTASSSVGLAAFLISCQRNLVNNNLLLLDKPAYRTEWGAMSSLMPLSAVNAFYDRTKNRMVVLAGIMQQPFLYENVPNYINYAKLGMVVGHEMMHGFDNEGWYFDKDGNINPWWTKGAAKAFQRNSKCLVNQYNKYPYGTVHPKSRIPDWDTFSVEFVDGNKTLPENIADNGGIKYAYQAYKHWAATGPSEKKPVTLSLNENQLFFLSYAQMWCQVAGEKAKRIILADSHSPCMYRVIGPLSNFKEFGKVFNCPVGSKMNPASRCEFW